jgi:hypothetical protein
MQMAPGVVDPMFLYELAETLGQTVQQMTTGRPGMSAHELCVGWPTYFKFKHRAQQRAQEEAKAASRRV